jgi:hypothetical protein
MVVPSGLFVRREDAQHEQGQPGVLTTSWEVTGVLAEGGVPFGERSESVLPLSAPQAKKNVGLNAVLAPRYPAWAGPSVTGGRNCVPVTNLSCAN